MKDSENEMYALFDEEFQFLFSSQRQSFMKQFHYFYYNNFVSKSLADMMLEKADEQNYEPLNLIQLMYRRFDEIISIIQRHTFLMVELVRPNVILFLQSAYCIITITS